MSIRRKSTTHDLATLRLHPDGSRVQQSSSSARQRTAKYTVIDPRGNWIAQDAGGRASVKKRRTVSAVPDDEHRETTRTSPERDGSDCGGRGPRLDLRRRSRGKGKQRASEEEEQGSDLDGEPEPLDARTRQRLSFMQDFNFLDPPEVVTGLPVNPEGSHGEDGLSLPHPANC
ncbi:hypothetical protein ID866_7767 [Astraeus odoratus]|nr:hypothetical protein ID866_7767 [Astraeus odoratus]